MRKILVAYATKHNSTAEIADAIGEVLGQSHTLQVHIRPVETVRDVTAYDGVVLGSAVYMGQWQFEAAEFLKLYETELARRPVWLFSSGPTGEGEPQTIMRGWKLPEALLPLVDRIQPRGVALFHGKLEPGSLSFLERGAVMMVHAPLGDFRDWDMIEAWARDIALSLADVENLTPTT